MRRAKIVIRLAYEGKSMSVGEGSELARNLTSAIMTTDDLVARRTDIHVESDEEISPRFVVSAYGKHGYSHTVIDRDHKHDGPKYVANFFAYTEREALRAERFASQLADQLNEEAIP